MESEETLPVIEIRKITENEDGSANVELDLDVEAVRLLLNVGLQKLLTDHMNEQEIKNDNN